MTSVPAAPMPTYIGDKMKANIDSDDLVLRRDGRRAKQLGAETRIPLDALCGVRYVEPSVLKNGYVRIFAGAEDPYLEESEMAMLVGHHTFVFPRGQKRQA